MYKPLTSTEIFPSSDNINESMVGIKIRLKMLNGKVKLFGSYDYADIEEASPGDVIRKWDSDKGWRYYQIGS